jgi:HEAT repeat protein
MKKTASSLADKGNIERWKAVIELERFGQPAADYLIPALKDEDRWVRYLAADALANIGASESVTPLIALLKDPDQDVRFAAASALGKIGDPKAVSPLESVLKNDNAYVRIAAEEAIGKISPVR